MKFNFDIIIVFLVIGRRIGLLGGCVQSKRIVPIFNVYMEGSNNDYDFIQQIEKDKQKENIYMKQNQRNQNDINKMFVQISSMQLALEKEINGILQTTNDIYNRFEKEIKPLLNNTNPYSVENII